jgi:hypothetical protein
MLVGEGHYLRYPPPLGVLDGGRRLEGKSCLLRSTDEQVRGAAQAVPERAWRASHVDLTFCLIDSGD